MTTPSTPGGRSPLWISGVALIGVGVVAGVVGLVGLGSDTESSSAAPPTTSAPAAPPETTAPAPSSTPGTSPLTPGAPGTPGSPGGQTATPGDGSGGSAGSGGSGGSGGEPVKDGDGGSAVAARPVVRVYNNSTIKGLAEKAAEEFRAAGWTVSSVQNYPQGIIPSTTVYYRPGTQEKAAADEMARRWGMRSEARFAGIEDATPGIIVIVTKDFKAA